MGRAFVHLTKNIINLESDTPEPLKVFCVSTPDARMLPSKHNIATKIYKSISSTQAVYKNNDVP